MTTGTASATLEQDAPSSSSVPTRSAETPKRDMMLRGPILTTMLRLSLPTVVVLVAQTLVGVVETYYVSFLGTDALAGASLVFPAMMIMVMMSNGGIGGGVASSIARALGSGRQEDADALVSHALFIAVVVGLIFTAGLLIFGRTLYGVLGGEAASLDAAETYSLWLFAGAIPMWIVNLLCASLRGAGNFKVPALVVLLGSATLVPLSPLLIFGIGPAPRLGIAGAGIAVTAYYTVAAIYLMRYVSKPGAGVALRWTALQGRLFADILKVGLLAAIYSALPNVTTLVVTAAVGTFGVAALAGYGASSRIDYVLVPILFGVGTAVVTMVGVNVGAGNIARARRIAWTGAVVGFIIAESVGLLLAFAPTAWLHFFSQDPSVVEVGAQYLHVVGPIYGALGVGMLLSLAAQGSGRVLWPTLASAVRMVVSAGIGWTAVVAYGGGLSALFTMVAIGLLCFGLITALATRIGLIWPSTVASPTS